MDLHGCSVATQTSAESSHCQHLLPGCIDSWLTSLQLVAVQPACLKSHTDTPILHHDQQLGQVAAEQAGAPQQQQQQPGQQYQQQQPAADLQHHELMLQLQVTLTKQHQSVQRDVSAQGPHLQVSSVAAGANMANCQLLPIPVHKAVLQVVLLNRQMQVLLHKQYSFQQLLQEQQQQHQLGAASSSSAPTAFTTAAAAAGSSQGVSSCLSSSQHTDQVLHLNIQLSAPSQPSAYTLDALHLFVTLCSAQLADPAEDDSEGQQQQACLVAELPLLVMPAPAQQEVQQLLLPAMRQDVQCEQLRQQEHLGPAAIAQQSLQVEQAVWQHFNQLALDILLIMQLSETVRTAHATDTAMSVAVDSSQPRSPSAASSLPATEELLQQHEQDPEAQHGMPLALGASSAMDNLLQAVNTLLLPLLLPFLTAHGLHSTLQVLLQCLPPQLQLQQHWQQQQLVRLHALTAQVQQQEPAQLAQDDVTGMDPGAAAAALPALGDMVVVSSAMLDTPLAPPVRAACTSAPAAAECAGPSRSTSSVFESVGSGGLSPEASSYGQQVPGTLLQQAASSSGVQASTEQPGSSGAAQQQQQQQPAAAAATSSASASTSGAGASAGAGAGGGLRMRGVAAARMAGRSPSGDDPDESRGGSDNDSGRSGSGRSRSGSRGVVEAQGVSAYQFGLLTEATGMPCWLVPFRQFEDSDVERRYVAYKHHQLLFLDMLGGLYQLAVAASLTKRSLFEHPATWILLLMTLIKALPHVPLLLGYRQKHIRFRELWMFLAAPCIGLLLCFLVLFTNSWQPSAMPPMPVAYRSFWRMHGELITAALRAFFQHMRLRPFILYTLVDRVISMQIWAPWSGVLTAVGRSAQAGVVSVVVCWALELCYRRRFVLAGLYRPAGGSGGEGGAPEPVEVAS